MAYKAFQVEGVGAVHIYKRRTNRSLKLTVTADGVVRVTMPLWAPYRAGVAFAASKRAWIAAHSQKQVPEVLKSGLRVGKSHRLIFLPDNTIDDVKTSVRGTEVRVTHSSSLSADHPTVQLAAKNACWRALRLQAESLLAKRLDQLANLHNIPYNSLHIKRMKSRWGSCDQHNNIVLNSFLVQLPWEFIDYVIRHELTHTRVMHHGADFWHALETLQPGAKRLRKEIRHYQPSILIVEPEPSVA